MVIRQPLPDPPPGMDVLWRLEARRYSICLDPEREEYGVSDPRLELWWYEVHKRTSKGAWIDQRFVLLTARKKFACNTKEEAIESFRQRRLRQIKILQTQLARAQDELALIAPLEFASDVI